MHSCDTPPGRLERPTQGLGNLCSIHLSYGGRGIGMLHNSVPQGGGIVQIARLERWTQVVWGNLVSVYELVVGNCPATECIERTQISPLHQGEGQGVRTS